jgi:hypothetical protein
MADSVRITPVPFTLTLFEAHPGKVFTGVDVGHFRLKWGKLKFRVIYLEKITAASFSFSWSTVADLHSYRSEITEASFTILTSRTDPLEPQPVNS